VKSTPFIVIVILCASALAIGCGIANHEEAAFEEHGAKLSMDESECLVHAVNNCSNGYTFFDESLQWDRRAAQALLDSRNGTDGVCGTSDDTPFSTIEEVDALPFVGPVAMSALLQHGWESGCVDSPCNVPDSVVDGVLYTYNQESNVLDWANRATEAEMLAIPGIGATIAKRLLSQREALGEIQSIQKISAIEDIGPVRLAQLRFEVPSLWCTQVHSKCGCSPAVRELVRSTVFAVKNQFKDRQSQRLQRFITLLGEAGFNRYAEAVTQELASQLWLEPKALQALQDPLDLVAPFLTDAYFLNPFELIDPTPINTDDLLTGLNAAVDAAIMYFNQLDLADSSVGVSFADLVTGLNETLYLDEITGWRTLNDAYVTAVELDHVWIFMGTLVGLPCEVSVSRTSGRVLEVVVDIP
jgi:hypothetical protein